MVQRSAGAWSWPCLATIGWGAPGAQVGQPEGKLGIIPGAGGTQRLPRLAGVAKAVEMCAQGNPIPAREALDYGILDRLIEGDLLTGAIAFARAVLGKPAPFRWIRLSTM
jgi:3-hydroxyacyl-CoA dehydrogenase